MKSHSEKAMIADKNIMNIKDNNWNFIFTWKVA